MNPVPSSSKDNAVTLLRRMAQPRIIEEQCELCSVTIPGTHRHLLETAHREIICACETCGLRFQDVIGGRYRLIPRDVQHLADFKMADSFWDDLNLPINLTFLYRDSSTQKMVAMFPSPAGAVESLLSPENWQALEVANPTLVDMTSDVEALLVNRLGNAPEYFLVPIDVCYELAGLIRMHWRGLSGGDAVWEHLDHFFAGLRERAGAPRQVAEEAFHA